LGDASIEQVMEALIEDAGADAGAAQAIVEKRACAEDDLAFRAFRNLLLIREDRVPSRQMTWETVGELFATSHATEGEPDLFSSGRRRIRCDDPTLRAALRRLIAASPERIRVRDLDLDEKYVRAVISLFDFDILSLHTIPAPCALAVPDRPSASPLARVMVGEGLGWVATLEHRIVNLDAGTIGVVARVDGSHERDTLESTLGEARIDERPPLMALAKLGLLRP
jgi:hypothetical protein